jgi:hypothetical protein
VVILVALCRQAQAALSPTRHHTGMVRHNGYSTTATNKKQLDKFFPELYVIPKEQNYQVILIVKKK